MESTEMSVDIEPSRIHPPTSDKASSVMPSAEIVHGFIGEVVERKNGGGGGGGNDLATAMADTEVELCCIARSSTVSHNCTATPHMSVAHRHPYLYSSFRWELQTFIHHLIGFSLNHRDWKMVFGESFFPRHVSPVLLALFRFLIFLAFLCVYILDFTLPGRVASYTFVLFLTDWQWTLNLLNSLILCLTSFVILYLWSRNTPSHSSCSVPSVLPDGSAELRSLEASAPLSSLFPAYRIYKNRARHSFSQSLQDSTECGGRSSCGFRGVCRICGETACVPPPVLNCPFCSSTPNTDSSSFCLSNCCLGNGSARFSLDSRYHRHASSPPPPPPASPPSSAFVFASEEDGLQPTQQQSTGGGGGESRHAEMRRGRGGDKVVDRSPKTTTETPSLGGEKNIVTKSLASLGSNCRDTSITDSPPSATCVMASFPSPPSQDNLPCPPSTPVPFGVGLCWVVQIVSIDITIGVMVLYWCLLVPLGGGEYDFFDMWKHLLSGMLTILSAVLGRIPFHMSQVLYSIVVGLFYALLTVLVYAFNVKVNGRTGYVYGVTNLKTKPVSSTMLLFVACFVLIPTVHLLMWTALRHRNTYVAPPPEVCCRARPEVKCDKNGRDEESLARAVVAEIESPAEGIVE